MSLRSKLIRLAKENPGPVRSAILPLLKRASSAKARKLRDQIRDLEDKGHLPGFKANLPGEDYVTDAEIPKMKACLDMYKGMKKRFDADRKKYNAQKFPLGR